MNIRASFKYRFRDMLRGALLMNGIVIAIIILSAVPGAMFEDISANFAGGYEMAALITVFVCGIVTIREDLRLANQCGRGRISAFAANTLSHVASAAVYAVLCQAVSAAASFATRNIDNYMIMSIWSMTYFGDFEPVHTLTFGEHLMSILANFGIFTAASMCGVFCSALFYKIPSKWTAVAGVAFGVFIGMGIPAIVDAVVVLIIAVEGFANFMDVFVKLVFSGPVNLGVSALVFAAIAVCVNFLLVRRVAVRAPGEKG